MIFDGNLGAFPTTLPATIAVTVFGTPAGDYSRHVWVGEGKSDVACSGSIKALLKVVAPAERQVIVAPISNLHRMPLALPAGRGENSKNSANGEIACDMQMASCPNDHTGIQNMNSGNLECMPLLHRTLPCPNNTSSWEWGSSFCKTDWQDMGCTGDVKPPN